MDAAELTQADSAFVSAAGLLTVEVKIQVSWLIALLPAMLSRRLTVTAQVPLPAVAKTASGDALLVPSSGAPLQVHSAYLALGSDVLETAIELAKSQATKDELLHLPLPHTSLREAALLVAALYARELSELLDTLPAARLQELADVCHRFSCDILQTCGDALVRKVKQGGWLTPGNALAMLSWSSSRGLPAVRIAAAQYAASHVKELPIDEAAAEASDDLALLLLCQQGKSSCACLETSRTPQVVRAGRHDTWYE